MSLGFIQRWTLSASLVLLFVSGGTLRADTSFPDYYKMNNQANKLSPADIPALTAKGDGGDATSQILPGLAFQNGHGVPMSLSAAFNWYRKAAEQGNPMGENLLGLAYDLGLGTAVDGAEAFRKAAGQGDFTAQNNLGISLKNGVSLPKNVTDAREQVEQEADRGDLGAEMALGLAYAGHANRLGIHKDYEQGAAWLKKASEKGAPLAQTNLAALYIMGKGVPKDEGEGLKLLLRAAETRYSEAFYYLGEMYERGEGVAKDKLTADMYYLLAEDSGKEILSQSHGGISPFPDHKIKFADREKARKLADDWEAAHGNAFH
jgi:TPR repeat protein